MKKTSFALLLSLSLPALASDGFEVLSHIGVVYERTEGNCATHMDIMKWGTSVKDGIVTFAQTYSPLRRPLDGYVQAATMSAVHMRPLGEGEFTMEFNQPTPIKAEYEYDGDSVTIFAHNKGKGSWGGFFGDSASSGHAATNQKFSYTFSNMNEQGLYTELETSYQNFKGLFNGKKVSCKFKLK